MMYVSIWKFEIPYYLVFLLLAGLFAGFVVWRKRKLIRVNEVHVFDLVLLTIVSAILIGRLLYIFEHIDVFSKLSWSIYPYYYEPGAERIWFRQAPWAFLKFWDYGVNFQGLLLGGILGGLLLKKFSNKLSKGFLSQITEAVCLGTIIQIAGFWISKAYRGDVTTSFIGVSYGDDSLRYPVQLIEITILLLFLVFIWYVKRKQKKISLFGLYLIVFGSLEILITFITDREVSQFSVGITQILYLLLIFVGIVIFIFVSEEQRNVTKKQQFVISSNSPGQNEGRQSYSYRDFQQSYANYRKQSAVPGVNILQRIYLGIKRKIRSKGNVDSEKGE